MLSYLSSGRFHLQQNEQSIDKVISAIAAWSSIQTMQTAQNEHASLPGEQSPYSATASTPQEPPANPTPKNVAFELLLDENSKVRARIPMRVQIYPHDTTDSIVTTVKNFYGIYDGAASGVSFEDENGITLIARYENLRNNMTVYVRVIPIQAYTDIYGDHYHGSIPVEARKHPNIEDAYRIGGMQPAHLLEHGRSPSRPASRIARKRSPSPSSRSRRSASQNKQSKSGNKSRGSSTHGSFHDDGAGYSDSDATYTSKKARSDHFASSDISMDNILQDGRRKRPKFDSSELPLFVPPQVPLTTASISPQRRSVGQEGAGSPFARPTQRPYSYQQPFPSPQSYGYSDQAYGTGSTRNSMYATPVLPEHGHRLRDRTSTQQFPNAAGRASGPGILPTPDPTIASCISDEDVAMQLIRLGDASNFSHGRTSASTLDDGFSGAADAASSTGATSDGEDFSEDDDGLPSRSRQKLESSPMLPPGASRRNHKRLDEILPSFDSTEPSGDDLDEDYRQEGRNDILTKSEADDDTLFTESGSKSKKTKTKATGTSNKSRGKSAPKSSRGSKTSSTAGPRKTKAMSAATSQKGAAFAQLANSTSPRKTLGSSANFQLAADEEDLSTKPRCQRCRKSKKGCDRQRPCGRCRDAGIGLEGCISEDEGNGRKGRYGRHMGVPVKKALELATSNGDSHADPAFAPSAMADKSKKRKR